MCFIHCGDISKYSLLYIVYSFCSIMDTKLTSQNKKNYKSDENIKLSAVFILLMFISEFLSGMIGIGYLCLSKYCNKPNNNEEYEILNINNMNQSSIMDNTIGQECHKKWIKIIFVCIFDSIYTFVLIYDWNLQKIVLTIKSFLLLFTAIFSSFYLKYTMYRHHIAGIGIVIFGTIINDILFYKKILDIDFILLFSVQLINAWEQILEKDLIEINFLGIYELLAIEGIIGFIFSIVIIQIFFSVEKIKQIGIEIILIFLVSCGVYNICRLKIIQIYGPIHRCVGDNFVIFILWIIDLYDDKYFELDDICHVIGYICCIIGSIIFTEMISISLCNLNINTKKEQIKRAVKKLEIHNFLL